MGFLEVPQNQVEWRLVSPRIPMYQKLILIADLRYTNHVMCQNVRPYKVRKAAEYLVIHGKLFKDQGIVFDTNWEADNDERDNDSEINGDTGVPETYIDSRVKNIPNEPQPGCSHWNDSLNDAVKECKIN